MRSVWASAVAVMVLASAVATAAALAQSAGATGEAAAIEELVRQGQPVFEANCRGCHGASGRGYIGPGLVGNDHLADPVHVFRQITRGGDEMPAFLGTLTTEQVLAVGTYVRNSWGNDYGILSEADVGRE